MQDDTAATEKSFQGSGPNEGGGAWTSENAGQPTEGSVLAGSDPGGGGAMAGGGASGNFSEATNSDPGQLPQVERGELQLQNEDMPVEGGQTYTVEDGDTLHTLAARFYGSALEWERIYQANSDKLSNPDLIYPGQELLIPAGGSAEL